MEEVEEEYIFQLFKTVVSLIIYFKITLQIFMEEPFIINIRICNNNFLYKIILFC